MNFSENPLWNKAVMLTRRKAGHLVVPATVVVTTALAYNAGVQIGINQARNPTDFEITQEPYEVQIRRFEEDFKPNNL